MISLSSEITESKGRRARAGWLFYDGDCPFCTRLALRLRIVLERRGFGLARLQDPRAQALLALPEEEFLREMRLCTADGRQFGGADALIYLAGKIWWALPAYALAHLPGMRRLIRTGYRAVAMRRSCTSGACGRKQLSRETRQVLEEGGRSR